MHEDPSTGQGEGQLHAGLKQRHMTMISLGGVIGAGLFVGSGAIIADAGPAAILSYLLTGLLVVLIMRMLGEMAVAQPVVGAFTEYARRSVGPWAGFSLGWLYWYFWVVVVGVEAVAGASILEQYIPGVPLWTMSLVLVVLLTLTNLISVRSFGEFEFWFASIKVAAIIVFIILGATYVLGFWPAGEESTGLANLTERGGFAPNGFAAAFTGIATVIFAFVGAEIVTIAAAESAEPERAVAKATNAVIYRVLIFYVVSVFLVVCILPWDNAQILQSPFVSALDRFGIPGAGDIMNFVILTAVLSVLNSALYTSSRMLFALTRRGEAPQGLAKVNSRGVPVRAILLGTVVGYVAVVMSYVSPDTVFAFLLNSSGAIALFVYLLIAISELRMRRQLERDAPDRLIVKMWLYPFLTYLSIAGIVGVLVLMLFNDDARSQLLFSLISVAVVLVAYFVQRGRGRVPDAEGVATQAGTP